QSDPHVHDRRAAARNDRYSPVPPDLRAGGDAPAESATPRERRGSGGARARLSRLLGAAYIDAPHTSRRARGRRALVAPVTVPALVTAFRLETRAVLASLADVQRLRPSPRPCWSGRAGTGVVRVVEGGVGPAGAQAAVAALPPGTDLIASIGFAGAL